VTDLVRSELLKVRTTRGWYAYLVVLVLLSGIAAAADTGSAEDFRRGTLEFQIGLVEAAGFAGLLALILGITVVTSEFRHGTITPTFLTTPARERVLGAKAVAVGLLALLFFVIALAVIAAVALIWLTVLDADLHLGSGELWERVAQTLLGAVLWGLMGVAVGTLVHSQVGALVGTLIWIFAAEPLLSVLVGVIHLEIWPYFPFQALDAADGTTTEEMLSYPVGVTVTCAWIALVGAAGVWRTRSRDIS
jgi:ABC-2 type transport system permease protein